ncbi:MAG: hypothetical protein HRU70_06335 [Phycisphaeraceae bacterium]|nr:MAG: hypothetical protein HRU70_06335 [Phycisphaeraceae bacterium]
MLFCRAGRWCVVAGLAAIAGGVASAQPLEMTYSVSDADGGLYRYEFALTLTNSDGSWVPGQGFGWVIFGDRQQDISPINDFVGDPSYLPVGPFECYSGSGGFHNGPTFCIGRFVNDQFELAYWVPESVGESLVWAGTSSVDVPEGEMLWSNLLAIGGAGVNEFIVARRIDDDGCAADFNGDGFVDFFDFQDYVDCFEGFACPDGASADFNDDGFVDFFDFQDFVDEFDAGC